jgi:peptidoglycan-associated lipoprotein
MRPILAGLLAVGLPLLAGACANQDLQPDSARLGPAGQRVPATPGSQRDFTQNVGDIVYFSTDSTDLTPEAQQTLANQARWLQQYAQYTLTIEGHADERGTREYNIALGNRRAVAVRDQLQSLGVAGTRLSTISYGKERPAVVGSNEAAWSQNRRSVTGVGAPSSGSTCPVAPFL